MAYIILSAAIFTIYNVSVIIFCGKIPYSVSKTYYILPEKYRFLFTLTLWLFSTFAFLAHPSTLMFLSMAGIYFVGSAPKIAIKREKRLHMIFAISGTTFGMASVYFDGNLKLFIASVMVIAALGFLKPKNYVFWLELVAFYSILLSKAAIIFM